MRLCTDSRCLCGCSYHDKVTVDGPSRRFSNLQPCDQAHRTCPRTHNTISAPPQPPSALTAHVSGKAPTTPRPPVESPRISANPNCVLSKGSAYVIQPRATVQCDSVTDVSLPRQIGQRQTCQDIRTWQNRYLYVTLRLALASQQPQTCCR